MALVREKEEEEVPLYLHRRVPETTGEKAREHAKRELRRSERAQKSAPVYYSHARAQEARRYIPTSANANRLARTRDNHPLT